MKKAAIHNLGCKVNSYEAESMEQMLINAGYTMVSFGEEPADVYIINTCSVTNIADRKSRQMLHKAKKLNPSAVVIAAGCYAQADSENVAKDEAVDIVLGNNMKINLIDILDEYFKNTENHADNTFSMEDGNNPENIEESKNKILSDSIENVIDLSKNQPYEELEIDRVNEHTRAYIKIQDGCNQFCSYCIIPYTRGRIRSRNMSGIIKEVERLVDNGYKEIVLTGIHLSSYGLDNGKGSLLEVIESVNNIEGVERIRLGSLEPRIVTEEFVAKISLMDKICPHFHLSLQSGCDATLKRMNRKYNTAQYMESCNILRKYFDNPAITTDVIVGFPAETDEEFECTRAFLQKIHFYEMHIFKYSRRRGTVADKMDNQIDEKIKTKRSAELLKLEHVMSEEYRRSFLGKNADILVEEVIDIDGVKYYAGYTKNYIRVVVPVKETDDVKGENSYINSIIHIKCESIMEDGVTVLGCYVQA